MMLKTRTGDIAGIGGPPSLFPGQDDRDVLLSREEAAAYLRVSLPTLELWARNGEGPRVVRVGRAIRYRLADVRALVEEGASSVRQSA
jgi:excisionase family DNA binding protein